VTTDRTGSGGRLPWDPVAAAAGGLAIDAATAEAVVALRDAGVRSILLKGPSFDTLLYDPDEPRPYSDIDLLIRGADAARAAEVLETLGYRERADREPSRVVEHARVWVRASDRRHMDLHQTLGGVDRSDVDPWDVLATDTESLTVGRAQVEILSQPARALHVALHAAVAEPDDEKPGIDLSRALERLSIDIWTAAAALAERLRASPAFATGLRRLPAGAKLAEQLGLAPARSVEAALLETSAPYSAWTVEQLSKARGLRAKLRILLPRLFPKPQFMRVWYPSARRGRGWLALAYLRRVAWLFSSAPRALRAWRRARRETQGSGGT
jgi:Uncharacterised nucleotidyltransferase